MRQVIEGALGNCQIVILNGDVNAGCRIGTDVGTARSGQSPVIGYARRRGALLCIPAALLTTAWTAEARCSPDAWYSPADMRALGQHKISATELDLGEPVGAL